MSNGFRAITKILTLRCSEASALLSRRMDGPLPLADRWALRMHLLICVPCRRYRRQLDAMRRMFRAIVDDAEKDPDPRDA